ncbi:MAG: hypothetical protein ACTSYX_08065 [Candidatus Thorarchaeota archaeon]
MPRAKKEKVEKSKELDFAPVGGVKAPEVTTDHPLVPMGATNEMMAAFAGPDDELLAAVPQVGVPYLYFHHNNAGQASNVLEIRPEVKNGDQFVIDGDEVHELPNGWSFTILNAVMYWAIIDITDGAHSNVTFEDPGRKDPRKKNLLTVTLIDTGTKFFATTSTWRGPKCPAPQVHMRQIKTAKMDEWVTEAPTDNEKLERGEVVKHTGPFYALRVWSRTRIVNRKSRDGFAYEEAKGRPMAAKLPQLVRFGKWMEIGGGAEAVPACVKAYNDRKEYLETLVTD